MSSCESENEDINAYDDDEITSAGHVLHFRNRKSPFNGFKAPVLNKFKYYKSAMGWVVNTVLFFCYTLRLVQLFRVKVPDVLQDLSQVNGIFKFRYTGSVIYFFACYFPKYVYEWRNAEMPLVVSTVMQVYYILSGQPADSDATIFDLLWPVAIAITCLLRRNRILRSVMNPWTKNPFEFQRLKRDIWRVLKALTFSKVESEADEDN